ncbi:hypothetical protein [Acinetobacter sp. HY1485]|uniref:hypothetical protein n=1 Tax=Acinetobacter sp. HY1485 TaxID=2970918 RepID=UPI0022B95F43|nr:hypothetical protein [Acinetobacter sp. HY1485]
MKFSHILLLVPIATAFTGCNTVTSIQYPAANVNKTLSVSSETTSHSKSVAGQHLIENTQTTVSGQKNLSQSALGSGTFGLLGSMTAMAMDKSANHNAIKKSTLNQAIKFDKLLNTDLKTDIDRTLSPNIKMLEMNQASDIKITPYAHLSFEYKPKVLVSYGVVSEFLNAANNNKKARREYQFISKQNKYTLPELEANNNALFTDGANKAFALMSQAIAYDINHNFSLNIFDEQKQRDCSNAYSFGVSFLKTPDNSCIGVEKDIKGNVIESTIFVTEQ